MFIRGVAVFIFFQGIRDHIRPVSKAVKKAVAITARPGIGAEDKLTSADVVESQFSAELLQEQIAGIKEPIFVQWNTGKR